MNIYLFVGRQVTFATLLLAEIFCRTRFQGCRKFWCGQEARKLWSSLFAPSLLWEVFFFQKTWLILNVAFFESIVWRVVKSWTLSTFLATSLICKLNVKRAFLAGFVELFWCISSGDGDDGYHHAGVFGADRIVRDLFGGLVVCQCWVPCLHVLLDMFSHGHIFLPKRLAPLRVCPLSMV